MDSLRRLPSAQINQNIWTKVIIQGVVEQGDLRTSTQYFLNQSISSICHTHGIIPLIQWYIQSIGNFKQMTMLHTTQDLAFLISRATSQHIIFAFQSEYI